MFVLTHVHNHVILRENLNMKNYHIIFCRLIGTEVVKEVLFLYNQWVLALNVPSVTSAYLVVMEVLGIVLALDLD